MSTAGFQSDSAGVDLHLPRSDLWELVFHLEIVKNIVFGDTLLKKLTKSWHVPLPITKVVNEFS